jgi:sulfur-carrier protein
VPNVRIPTPLRKLTDGQAEVVVEGDDLRTVVANLDAAHPGIGDRLLDDQGAAAPVRQRVRPRRGRPLPGRPRHRVGESDTVSIVPAVAGGA